MPKTRMTSKTAFAASPGNKPKEQLLAPREKERLSKKYSDDVRMSIRGVDLLTVNVDKPIRTKRGKALSVLKLASHFTEDSD